MLAFVIGFVTLLIYLYYFLWLIGLVLAIFRNVIKCVGNSIKEFWNFLIKKQKYSDDLMDNRSPHT